MQDLHYYSTLITVADDCNAVVATEPPARGGNKTAAAVQHEMLVDHPHEFDSEEIIFESWYRRQPNAADLSPDERAATREQFFSKPQACLRASPLAKSYGWGLLFDEEGKVALVARGSERYQELIGGGDTNVQLVKAMRSRRRSRRD